MNDAQKYYISRMEMRHARIFCSRFKIHFLRSTKKKKTFTSLTNSNGDEEESLRRAEEEEEEGEGRGDERGSGGYGAFKAWTEQVVDRVGVASQGCVRLACLVEIDRDRSVFLWNGE